MAIRVALHHRTEYHYDRPVTLGPQTIRLRPAPHCRTPIVSYSLNIDTADHYLNWQQDPYANFMGRVVAEKQTRHFFVDVNVVAEMTVINPFDFFLEPDCEETPFTYSPSLIKDLTPFLNVQPVFDGSPMSELLSRVNRTPRRTIDFLVDLNQLVHQEVNYTIRLEPGVQTCEETLTKKSGSCRDSAWLLVNALRHMGYAARFVSGYLIQLTADQKSLDGPSGPEEDFTDLHAWTEVFLPGAGWIGLDPTSGLFCGEGHIPLAATPEPIGAAPISGATSKAECEFKFHMSVDRVHEDPRVTKPYTETEWNQILSLGHQVDQHLNEADVRLTMGGEPTFVSIDDMEGEEWQTGANGLHKRRLSGELMQRLKNRFAPGGLMHIGQGKWYPGESLPRWALGCYWRRDGEPLWQDESLFADPMHPGVHTVDDARRFGKALAERLGVDPQFAIDGYEDALYYTWKERRLPVNCDIRDPKLENKEERDRLARLFENGITEPVGVVLPLRRLWWLDQPQWESGPWAVRADEMFLIPGDSPMGLRLPLGSLMWYKQSELEAAGFAVDGLAPRENLPPRLQLQNEVTNRLATGVTAFRQTAVGAGVSNGGSDNGDESTGAPFPKDAGTPLDVAQLSPAPAGMGIGALDPSGYDASGVVRTALCVETRNGVIHLFMPPCDRLEDYLDLVTAIEATASALNLPVVVEGYTPPHDHRLEHLKVTPDPGVIEVNVQPAHTWDQLVDITTGVYEDARQSRLGTEKFDLDGTHTGTGGGNHIVLGGASPADSPFLRRPDLLRSLVAYWHNHPSLSYLLSGMFIGPTSQAPRVDEGRRDSVYELEIAFQQLDKLAQETNEPRPWLVDRALRDLLVDITGNTHRAEFCIDKLFSPDSGTGRLGLVEFRGFEMPPHAQMSLAQQALLRCLVARFWEQPYRETLVDWDTSIHDRWMLPHFVKEDFEDVCEETQRAGYNIQADWFATHFEFRFPVIGEFVQRGVHVELRKAIEPWYVLGEEPAGGATARYVDSSVERLQVLVQGLTDARHTIVCNGRQVPLHPTGVQGEYVAGVRYRAWQPPSCLHPSIPIDSPLKFDLLDRWLGRSIGGCSYHVSHPGGLNPATFPVNSAEAESRRAARFFTMGQLGGAMQVPAEEHNKAFPMTLDLRRQV